MSIPKGSQSPCAYGYESTMAVFESRGPNIPSRWTASECEYLNSETTVVIFTISISSCQWGGIFNCLI